MVKKRRNSFSNQPDNTSPVEGSDVLGSVNDEDREISKSELKREMTRLQKLGEALLNIKLSELSTLPIDETLLEALTTAARIKHREGKRRQLQYVGKLMRREKPEAIQQIELLLERKNNAKKTANSQFHQIEIWRDKILASDEAIEAFINKYARADRQHMRQLTRQHKIDLKNEKPLSAARKLFTYLRDLIQSSSEK